MIRHAFRRNQPARRCLYQRLAIVLAFCLSIVGAAAAQASEPARIYARGLFKDRAILEINGKQRMLRAGQTSPEGIKLISANAKRAVIERNGERATLELGGRFGGVLSAPRNQSYRIVPSVNGMFVTTGSINGYPIRLLVDTGATLVSMNSTEARRLGIQFRVDGTPGHSSTASGISPIWRVRLERVKVGEIELENVAAAVHEGEFPQITLLGMSFLGRLEMTRTAGALLLERKY